MAAALIGGGMSMLGDIQANTSISKTSKANYEATMLKNKQKRAIQENSLLEQGQEVATQLGIDLTSLGMQESQAESQTVVRTVESNIYGMTAQRVQQDVGMQAAIMAANITQKAESAMKQIQLGLTDAAYDEMSGADSAYQNYQNSMNQRVGGFESLTKAVGAGVSFASAANGYNQTLQ